jgi:PAS domain S-box-containing protein
MERTKQHGATTRRRWPAALIAGGYLAVAVAWILLSDRALHAMGLGAEVESRVQTYKVPGGLVATTLGLYVLVRRALREQERANRELSRVRERYELAIKGTNDGIWDWDIATDRIYWSGRATEMLGMTLEDSQYGPSGWTDRIHPEDRGRVLEALRAHFERDEPYDAEYRVRVGNGGYRWFRSRGRAIRDAGGKPVRMAGSLADVQERVAAQQSLATSEAQYRRIVETAQEGIWVVDTGWATTFVNARMGEMLGCGTEEMTGRCLSEFMDEAAARECERTMRRREEGVHEQRPFRLRRKDGSELWVVMSANPITDEHGRFVGALAMVTDVTARRRAEEAAGVAESLFRSTFEHAAVGISNVTLEGRWLMVNDRMCRFLGRDRATLLGKTFADVTHSEDVGENERLRRWAVEDGSEGGGTYAMEKRYVRPDGTVVWGHVTASLVRDHEGRPLHFISVVQDISDRKRAEQQLEKNRRTLEQAQQVGRIGSWEWEPREDGESGRLEWSAEVYRIFGVGLEEFDGTVKTFFERVHPADKPMLEEHLRAALAGERMYNIDHRIVRPEGASSTVRWVHEQAEVERDDLGRAVRMIGVVQDITGRAEAERLGAGQRRVLEMMAAGAPLERTIGEIVRLVEGESSPPQSAIGGVLRLDEAGRMWTLGESLLPRGLCATLDGMEIGSGAGCCGRAMHEKRRVVAGNIATDPACAPFRGMALGHGMRACWSEPILASDGTVLGSLAMYFREPREPTERDLCVLTTAAHLAGIAMERARIEESRDRSEQTTRALLAAIPDFMFRVDRAGRYLDYHAPDPSRLLVPPERFMGRTVEEVLPPNLARQCREGLERLFQTGEAQWYEYESRREDGREVWWEVRMVLGKPEEALLLVRDVTERKIAERRVLESEERLRLLVENTPLAVIYWDMEYRVTGWNRGAERIFGHTETEAIGKNYSFIVPEPARKYVDGVMRALGANRGGFRGTNQNVRKDGALVHCEWYNCPLVDHTGRVIGIASVAEDVTERRQAQQRQNLMMAELDHRVKNNLAAVLSLAEQTGRSSAGYREFLDNFMGRVRAMSRMHTALAGSRWQGADLRMLATQTLEAYASGSAGRASVEGPSVMLGARAAQSMAMALNELATNAVKYGALSAAGGRVALTWETTGDEAEGRTLRFRWIERGGPRVEKPSVMGFGSRLIEGVIGYELRGKVSLAFEPEGVVCDLEVPLKEEPGYDILGVMDPAR